MRDLRTAIRNQPPAEHSYDWDPIHMPGFIQSYGVLVVADQASGRVQFVSENIAELLGVAPARLLDRPLSALADDAETQALIARVVRPETILFPNPIRLTIGGMACDGVFHSHAGHTIVELEPVEPDEDGYDRLVMRAAGELFNEERPAELFQRAVNIVRETTGFDRVLLYRFDARYNGQVVAEARREGVDSFLGLFFPSSDIGARSRDLYLKNFTRYIPDISGPTHRLVGLHPGGGAANSLHPVDRTHANLRGVVPCHVTYLQNMGVGASMSFSINVDGRLWGLFACHHYAPRRVSFDRRVVCEQTAMMFIFQLSAISDAAARATRRRHTFDRLSEGVSIGAALQRRFVQAGREVANGSGDGREMVRRALSALAAELCWLVPPDEPSAEPPTADTPHGAARRRLLLDLGDADSAAVVRHGRVYRIGDAPPEMSIYAVVAMLGRELPDLSPGNLRVFATDSLAGLVPVAEAIKDEASGVLVASLSDRHPCYVLWFRREQLVEATWAGNPDSVAMSRSADGLNPRASFEAWKQDIRLSGRPWALDEVEAADELAALLRGLDGRLGDAGGETAVPSPIRRPALETVHLPGHARARSRPVRISYSGTAG